MSEAVKSILPSRLTTLGGGLAVLGAILVAVGGLAGGLPGMAPSFLYGASFWILLTMGCFGLSLLFHITRGRWGTPVLRVFEAGSNTMMLVYVFVLAFVAAVVFKDPLYGSWANGPGNDPILQRKAFYLNYPFFLGRLALYFVLLAGIGAALQNWTRQEEKTGNKAFSDKRNNLAGPGIIVFILIMTFMTTDLLMSLDPHWFSTMWGFVFVVGSALGAMSLATMVVVSQRNTEAFQGKVDDLMLKDFGNLLLMLTMLWGYFNFSQFLIIWSGNLKELITFYLARLRGNFSSLGAVLVLGQFFAPFVMLLSPKLKRTPGMLMGAAGLIFFMRFLDMHWEVMPFFREHVTPSLADVGFLLALGGVWFALFGFNLRSAPLVTAAHPYQLKEASDHV